MSFRIAAITAGLITLVLMIWMIVSGSSGENAPTLPEVAESGPGSGAGDAGPTPQGEPDPGDEPVDAELIVTGVVVGEGRYPVPGIEVSLLTRFAEAKIPDQDR